MGLTLWFGRSTSFSLFLLSLLERTLSSPSWASDPWEARGGEELPFHSCFLSAFPIFHFSIPAQSFLFPHSAL